MRPSNRRARALNSAGVSTNSSARPSTPQAPAVKTVSATTSGTTVTSAADVKPATTTAPVSSAKPVPTPGQPQVIHAEKKGGLFSKILWWTKPADPAHLQQLIAQ